MLQNESLLESVDNSGARLISIINNHGRKFSGIGTIVVCSVKKVFPKKGSQVSSISKGQVVRALIVGTKKGIRRKNGSYLKFGKNLAILVEKVADTKKKIKGERYKPVGNRVNVPLPLELRDMGFGSFLSLTKEII